MRDTSGTFACGRRDGRSGVFLVWLPLLAIMVDGGCSDSAAPSSTAAPAVPTPQAVPPRDAVPAAQVPDAAAPPAATAADDQAPAGPNGQPPRNPANDPGPAKPRPILGKKTADIRDAEKEEAKGAQRVQPRITANDPITITGNAYVAIVGRTEILRIKHTLDLYHAETGRYPKDLDEFMKEIIKKSGIRLAQLPYYQEYGYDSVKHELVILEYPDRKARDE